MTWFLSFNKNDIGSSNILELIYPNEKISNTSKIPVFKILGVSLDQSFIFYYHFKTLNISCLLLHLHLFIMFVITL